MSEIPEPPRIVHSVNPLDGQNSSVVPAYRADLPTTIEGVEQERLLLRSEREKKNRGANTLLVLGMCSGAAACILPLNSCSAQLGGPSTLVNALNTFVAVLISCVLLGLLLGAISASLRSRVRFIDSRLRALDLEQRRLYEQRETGDSRL